MLPLILYDESQGHKISKLKVYILVQILTYNIF